MTRYGIDYSWGRPGGAAIAAAGYSFAIRYVDYPGADGKGLAADELADLHAHGVAVVLVFESTADRALDGFDAGVADAGMVRTQLGVLGWPPNRPVYFAVDFDAQPGQFAAIDAYLHGAATVLDWYCVGVYGSAPLLSHCKAVGTASCFWQSLAWSNGVKVPGRHLYQSGVGVKVNGVDCDSDESDVEDFGQWEPPKAASLPVPAARALTIEERVAKLEADHLALNAAVLARAGAFADVFGALAEGAVLAHAAAMAAADPAKVPGS